MIILPARKIIEPNRELVVASKIAGWYKLEATDVRTGRKRVAADWFPNLITDFGVNTLGTNAFTTATTYCRVGSGSTAPNVADTALVSQIASTSTLQSSSPAAQSSSPYYSSYTQVKRFGTGVAAGNLTEVGMGSAATGANLFSRALILDGGGSPTTITILPTETLDVTYQYRMYPPTSDVTGSIVIGGVTYNYTLRASNVTSPSYWVPNTNPSSVFSSGCSSYNNVIGSITSSPSGAQGSFDSASVAGYSNNSYQRDYMFGAGLNVSNISGGIRSCQFCSSILAASSAFGTYQIDFGASIPKDATKTLSLVFRFSWARKTLP